MKRDVEFLLRSRPLTVKEAKAADEEWSAGPVTIWAKDWDNEQDTV